jgi:general secretion pathway protein D
MRKEKGDTPNHHWLAARVLSFLFVAVLCSSALAQQPQRLTLNFTNTDIEAVTRAMADFTGRTFIVDPRVKGTLNLTVDQPLTPEQALGALTTALRLQNIALVDSGGVIRVVPEADARLQGGRVGTEAPIGRGDEIVTQVFRLNYESAVNIAQVLRPLVSTNNPINAYAGNNTIVVTDYAENVRRIARIIAAIDTPAGSEVDVIPLQYAIASDVAVLLARLLETPAQAGADAGRVSVLAEPSTNTLLVRAATAARANLVRVLAQKLDQPSAAPGNIHVVYLKNANAASLARTLLGIAPQETPGLSNQQGFQSQLQTQQSGSRPVGTAAPRALTGAPAAAAPVTGQLAGAQVQADPATNTLIIIAPDAVYRNLRAVIDKLDMRRAQVFIESLIIEVTSDQAAELGIQWQAGTSHLQGNGGAAGFAGTNFGSTGQNIIGISQNPGTIGPGLSIGVARGQITLPGIGTITNLNFLARALETMSKANILSTPNILTLDNEEARIIVGQNVPFVTGQYVTPASSGAATVNPFQTVERRDVGLTLRVRPQISESGSIKLVIYQEVSSVQDTTNPAGIITNLRAIETNVLVDDGSIVVLGGLVQDSVSNTTEKVPVLGDLPLIGGLFRFETRRQQKTNLMVFLRPFIVRDDADMRGVTSDRYERMRILEQTTRTKPSPVLPNFEPPALPPQVQP